MFSTIGYYICIPFAWLLRLFYNLSGSYGVAIIFFTLVIKLILLPFQMKSKKSMIRMSRMSGKIQEIQKKYANNQAKMNEEMQRFYQEEGISPMSGCLWSFIPLPIMLALYSIIREPITHFMMLPKSVLTTIVDAVSAAGVSLENIVQFDKDGLMVMADGIPQMSAYGQINLVEIVNTRLPELGSSIDGWMDVNYHFLGLDLTAMPWDAVKSIGAGISWSIIGLMLIPILSGALQMILMKITTKGQNNSGPAASSNKMMIMMMPLFSVYIGFILPAALGVYWIAQSAFSLVQESILGKFYTSRLEAEEQARFEAREADRKRRIEEGKVLQEQQRQLAAQKQSLKEKRKAAQEAKQKPKKTGTTEAGRVGERPYARGRSYREDRYDNETK